MLPRRSPAVDWEAKLSLCINAEQIFHRILNIMLKYIFNDYIIQWRVFILLKVPVKKLEGIFNPYTSQ